MSVSIGVPTIEDLPPYGGGGLGAIPDAVAGTPAEESNESGGSNESGESGGTTFRVWAPTASRVELRLFHDGDSSSAEATHDLIRHETDGTWSKRVDGVGHGTYYDYLVFFADGTIRRTADPWARAAGVNGRRSMVVDLRRTDPAGWDDDRAPDVPINRLVVWETHVGDFSNDPHSGVPAEHRGTYLAFTHPDTSVDGEGDFPTCMAYLRRLGVTAVQLMPIFDFGSVDEAAPRNADDDAVATPYNWGYDPVNYNVPEGSYSTDPFDGAVRIRECKRMIQALHANGFKVIMDVVYNHMYSADNWFERMVPGYCCRRYAGGTLSNGSGCGNDMASERPMMRKYIVDSVEYWAREYHIDGFRFDLMGLMDVDTMNAVRVRLDALPGGAAKIMYGEPWAADMTAVAPDVVLAGKRGLARLDPRIGFFSDDTRDAIRGDIFHHHKPGYVSGAALEFAPAVRHAVDAWRGAEVEPAFVGQLVQYVSAHDDLTLWDKLCATMRSVASGSSGVWSAESGLVESGPTKDDYEADPDCSGGVMEANRLAAGLVLSSAGVPFMLSGEEFARTKYGCDNSYDRPAALNWLDWRRARRLRGLVDYYAALIRWRLENPGVFGGPRIVPARDDSVIVFRVGNDCVTVNPTKQMAWQGVSALRASHDWGQFAPLDDSAWQCVFSSRGAAGCGEANWESYSRGHERQLAIPPRSFCIWRCE